MVIRSHRRFCPEFLAVVAATAWPVTEQSLAHLAASVESPFDWDHFLAITRRQRVAGLVSASLSRIPGIVPKAVREALVAEAQTIARNGILFLYETQRLLTELRSLGVSAAVLKGGPLGVLAYRHPSIRHSKDIDLLVPASQVTEAEAVLKRLGYMRLVPPENWSEAEVASFRELRSHFEFARPQTGSQVELHWRLSENPNFGVQFPPTITWVATDVGGGLSIPMLAMPDLLEYLCVHGASHAWSRLKWLADLAALLRTDRTLAGVLRQRGRLHGSSRAIDQALVLCRRFYDLALPADFSCTLPVRLLCRMAEDAMTVGCGAVEISENRWRNAELHLSHFLLSSRSRYLIAELRSELLMPPAWSRVNATPERKMLHRVRALWKRVSKD